MMKYLCVMNTTLNNIADIATGYPFRGKIESSTIGAPVIQMKDIKDKKVQWETILRSDLGGHSTHYLQENDLLCAGKARNNYFILLDELKEPTVCSPHFFRLRVKDPHRILPQYLSWLLNSDMIQNRLQAEQVGTTTFSIRKETLQKLTIPIPPIREQAHLMELAQTVEKHTQRQKQLLQTNHQLMNGIAQQLFKNYGSNTHG